MTTPEFCWILPRRSTGTPYFCKALLVAFFADFFAGFFVGFVAA
jgi:hypothetical protein